MNEGIYANHAQDEIRNIVQKRNNHEHKVLSPGNKPTDWSAYAQWEQSLESLRAKRCKRLKIRHLNSAHAGQGRVLSIYDRGVQRHANSGALWKEYLRYTASVKASKRFRKTVTAALRMMPHDGSLWILAGKWSAKNGDMRNARDYFLRGCRFCTKDATVWVERARCEMEWLGKLERKNKGNPAKTIKPLEHTYGGDEDALELESEDEGSGDEDGNVLPDPTAGASKAVKEQAQKEVNPAMQKVLEGEIPIMIFNSSRQQPLFSADAAEMFFEMFTSFRAISVQPRISKHVLDVMDEEYPEDPATCNCHVREPIIGVSPHTAEFPRALREVLPRLNKYMASTNDKPALQRKTVAWIDGLLATPGLDEGIKTVLQHTKGKVVAQ